MSEIQSAVEVSHLVKRFKNFTAVNDLSLTVRKGDYMGLLGPNGAGKSTTLKMISGLIQPTSGQILINGLDVTKDHRSAMAHVGTVIETPEFYPEFTPAEGLIYVGKMYGLDDREIEIRSRDVLEEVNMWDWRGKPIGKFSKGMRQRVMIAQAMLPNPELLILDEPTSGLDPRGMIEMRDLLNRMKRNGLTLLISTHMLREISEMCNRVTMINGGRTVISGDVSSLIRGADDGTTTLALDTLRPFTDAFEKELRNMSQVHSFRRTGTNNAEIMFKGTLEDRAAISDLVVSHGLGLISLTEDKADLEALYMSLTKGEEGSVR